MDLGGLQGMKAINRIIDLPCSMDKSYHFHWEVGLCSNRKAIIWPNVIFHQRFSWNNGISLPKRYILGAQVVWGKYNLTRVMQYSIWMYCIWVVAAIIFSHTQTLTNSHDWWVPCPSNMKSGRCSDRWMLQACYVTERRMKSSNKKTSLDRVPCQSIDSKTQKSHGFIFQQLDKQSVQHTTNKTTLWLIRNNNSTLLQRLAVLRSAMLVGILSEKHRAEPLRFFPHNN